MTGTEPLICGLKLTHDGGVTLLHGNRLITTVEVEKTGNRPRYSELDDLGLVAEVLAESGVDLASVDHFAVDGWGYGGPNPTVTTTADGAEVVLPVAGYREDRLADDTLSPHRFDGLPLAGKEFPYHSYHHTTGHVLSAYCASPFAERAEPSYVVVWDGGVVPRGYYVRPDGPVVENLGPILGLIGNVYPVFAMRFAPFRPADLGGSPRSLRYAQLSVPGKVMAYTALGVVREDLCAVLDDIYANELDVSLRFADTMAESFLRRTAGLAVSAADALASFQHWLGGRLVDSLRQLRELTPGNVGNLCFAGGCALNIKWNAAIRASGIFDSFWVPPFPNDSGSSLGAACAELALRTGQTRLDWSVYRGPRLRPGRAAFGGYASRDCSIAELAQLLHTTGEPVCVLTGRAELGPRALGNRSLLAAPTDPAMKDRLNEIKGREDYRPVSPVCLESRAREIFDPGGPDPFMLFEHRIRPEWASRVPAVVHVDGSARLQTVNPAQHPVLAELLGEYERHSGIPLLCNTSANRNGSGFFPDVESALRWGRCRYVWSDGSLWERDPEASHG